MKLGLFFPAYIDDTSFSTFALTVFTSKALFPLSFKNYASLNGCSGQSMHFGNLYGWIQVGLILTLIVSSAIRNLFFFY